MGDIARWMGHRLAPGVHNPRGPLELRHERSAALLKDRLEYAELATRALGAARLTDGQLAAVDEVRASCLATQAPGVLSPIQQAERENAIGDWLAAHGLSDAIAGPLAETAVTLEALDRIAAVVDGPALDAVLRWAAGGCSVRAIASEIRPLSRPSNLRTSAYCPSRCCARALSSAARAHNEMARLLRALDAVCPSAPTAC